jgi:phage-related tail protein
MVESKTVSVLPVKEKPVVIKKPKEPGKLSPWFNKVVQGVLDLVDDDNEDVPLK